MKTISRAWQWVWRSSVNPEKVSLSVKAFGVGIIPVVMFYVGLACTHQLLCIPTNADELTVVVNSIADIAFWGLSIIASIGLIVGIFRKLGTTVVGTNEVVASWGAKRGRVL